MLRGVSPAHSGFSSVELLFDRLDSNQKVVSIVAIARVCEPPRMNFIHSLGIEVNDDDICKSQLISYAMRLSRCGAPLRRRPWGPDAASLPELMGWSP